MERNAVKSFNIETTAEKILVKFQKKNDFNAIRQLEFSSRLMYGLKPDLNNNWVEKSRTEFHIVGFPPIIKWQALQDNILEGTHQLLDSYLPQYLTDLETAIINLCPKSEDVADSGYMFATTNGLETFQYRFNKRARAICALAVLYDLEWHPRKDLEIWIDFNLSPKLEPGKEISQPKAPAQFYGDPSKTADELRNEGWPREAENPLMLVESRAVNGQTQQHYKLVTRAQVSLHQKKRSNIKPLWRKQLFQIQDFTCQICLNDYRENPDQLSPDHRIPVIFEPDNLDDSNFSQKLMTLCRYCNQAKREFTKRLPHDYDWSKSPWAYPEANRISIIENQIRYLLESSDKKVEATLRKILGELLE